MLTRRISDLDSARVASFASSHLVAAKLLLVTFIWACTATLLGSAVVGWGDNSDGQIAPTADLTSAIAVAAGGLS
jgi:hypothetical protein